jgi:hypothetical protein
MTEPVDPMSTAPAVPGQQPPSGYPVQPAYGQPPAGYAGPGPIGKVRSTGMQILLFIVTFGIWGLVWYYSVHEEMKRHKGTGLGGALALVIAFFIGVVSPFLASAEVGELYERAGRPKPVSGATGLWYIPGFIILVGPIIWFVKTNGALNDYWKSLGATG